MDRYSTLRINRLRSTIISLANRVSPAKYQFYCFLSTGTQNSATTEFVAISAPPYTEVNPNATSPINKGNVAPIYTEQFNDKPNINGLEIRNLVKHQQEEAEQETLDRLNRDVVKPFQWSDSSFGNYKHAGLPDKWAFGPFRPKWSW